MHSNRYLIACIIVGVVYVLVRALIIWQERPK